MWAQLEHDPDASAICIVHHKDMANQIQASAKKQYESLKRQSILDQSKNNGVIVICNDWEDAQECINYCASEHLVLLSNKAHSLRKHIRHAGSIFCGPFTPVTLGDYYAGPNHVLPTTRSARFASPLGVMDFMKYSSYLEYSKAQLESDATDLNVLTKSEGFDGHYMAVDIRLNV